MSTLDNDVIFTEILPKLPAKSLNRLKCVSKSFKNLISSSYFAKLYLRYRSVFTDTKDLLVISGHHDIITCYDLGSTTIISTFDWYDDVPVNVLRSTTSIFWQKPINVVGSSNGLLCISIFRKIIQNYFCVLNPTTGIRQYIYIPYNEKVGSHIGFAFDPYNLDFKIVVISSRTTRIYSLNTNSWTAIETNLPGNARLESYHSGVGTLVNNHLLHWGVRSTPFHKGKIGCFDVCKNKWVDDVPLPHWYCGLTNKTYFHAIGLFHGCLFASFEHLVERCYVVWVMKEYGVQDSWYKLLSVPISDDFGEGVVPVACCGGSNLVLIRQRYTSRLLWYNRNNVELSEAKFVRAPGLFTLQTCMCSTSMVDVPDGKLFGDVSGFPG